MPGFELLNGFGAPVVIAMIVLSIVAMTISIHKVIQFQRHGLGAYGKAEKAMALWSSGDRMGALQAALNDRSQLGRVVAITMDILTRDPNARDYARQHAGLAAIAMIMRNGRQLRIIETIVQAAPMLGLLGTVVGMIEAFQQISQSGGAADAGSLANGIWIALITTAMGLAIAIPFYFVSVWLDSRLEQERVTLESAITTLTAG